MCPVSFAVNFDGNYKLHSFYIIVDMFKYMPYACDFSGIIKNFVPTRLFWKVSLSSGMLMKKISLTSLCFFTFITHNPSAFLLHLLNIPSN